MKLCNWTKDEKEILRLLELQSRRIVFFSNKINGEKVKNGIS